MIKSILQLILIQYKEFWRKPMILFWAIGFPFIAIILLGLSFANKKPIPVVVSIFCSTNVANTIPLTHNNCDNTDIIEKVKHMQNWQINNVNNELEVITQSKYYMSKVTFNIQSKEEAFDNIQHNKTQIILEYQTDTNKIIYHFDPQNNEAQKVHLQLSFLLKKVYNSIDNHPKEKVQYIKTIGYRYIDFLIPGLIAMSILHSCLWGIGWVFIELRSKNLLKRIIITPISKVAFLSSYFITRYILISIEFVIIYFVAKTLFQVDMQGSWLYLFIIFSISIFCFASIGLLIGSKTDTPRIGYALIESIAIPMIFLSGIFFNYTNFHPMMTEFIQYLPLALTADTIRSIFLGDIKLLQLVKSISVLSALGLICFSFGLKIYKWH